MKQVDSFGKRRNRKDDKLVERGDATDWTKTGTAVARQEKRGTKKIREENASTSCLGSWTRHDGKTTKDHVETL